MRFYILHSFLTTEHVMYTRMTVIMRIILVEDGEEVGVVF